MDRTIFTSYCEELHVVQDKIKYLKGIEKIAKKKLEQLCTGESRSHQGWTYAVHERLGSVEYAKIPQLEGIDLNLYRKDSINVWKLSFEKQYKEIHASDFLEGKYDE
jgi:hypothetical protein